MNYQKYKLGNSTFSNCIKNNNIPRNNHAGVRPVHWKVKDIGERNWRRHKYMERYTLLITERINIVF